MFRFFDKLEDKTRALLSRRPIPYAFVAGVGIVLFWRGVWHTADYFSHYIFFWNSDSLSQLAAPSLGDGLLSLALGALFLLPSGLFVSSFIGNEIIISGLRGERKLTEKTEAEVRTETGAIAEIYDEIKKISEKLK